MQTVWEGHFLNGLSAARIPVTVKPTPLGIEIHRASGITLWPYSEFKQTQGHYPGEPARLEREGEVTEALVIPDVSFLAALKEIAPGDTAGLHNPGLRAQRRLWIALAAVASVALLLGLYFWGIPAAAAKLAEQVPVAWEEKLGQTLTETLVEDAAVCDDAQANQLIEQMVKRLQEGAPPHPYTFRVTIVKHPLVNAFAAPGGSIVVFTGLLKKIQRPEELAGVLAHEMQHVIQRHGTKSIFQQISTSILVSLLAGDASGAMETVMNGAKTLGVMNYSRRHEREADILAMKMVQGARIDASGMVRFFENLEEEFGKEPEFLRYLSSHPGTADRIRTLEAMAREAAYEPVPLLSAEEWDQFLTGCLRL